MTARSERRPLTVALIGNPNTGKSTVFNCLCGTRQRVGNYPGVTVEKSIASTSFHDRDFQIIDVPGCYSLAPTSPDELVVVDLILGRMEELSRPDVLVCVVDASNLERNLYLVSQVLDLGLPTVVALNMMDVARGSGLELRPEQLAEEMALPVVVVQANRRIGIEALRKTIVLAAEQAPVSPPDPFPPAFQEEVSALHASLQKSGTHVPEYLVRRLVLDASGYLSAAKLPGLTDSVLRAVQTTRDRLRERGIEIPGIETKARYAWAGNLVRTAVTLPLVSPVSWTDRLDRLLLHRVFGSLVFPLIMLAMFQSVFYVAEPASFLIDRMNRIAVSWIAEWIPEGALQSLLIHGVVEGVGGVLVFLPQIFTVFLFIALLEDCGYMARAAYLMDRLMSYVGLSGKSFIPLISSFACAVPGIMAARVVESPRDRLITILIAPLMSCSARLPIYTLLIGAFIPERRFFGGLLGLRGITMFAMVALGIAAAVIVAILLRKTLIRGDTPAFIMELPSYRPPSIRVVLARMWERGVEFLFTAGTLIFAVSILVWAVAYFPHDRASVAPELLSKQQQLQAQLAQLESREASRQAIPETDDDKVVLLQRDLARVERQIEGAYLRHSFLGRAGRFIEPVVKPLGWDWRIGCAVIASLPAREVVIASLAVIYNLGPDEDDPHEDLGKTLKAAKWEGTSRPVFTVPVALSIMVFFALCAQCASTLAIIRRETGSWRWPAFTFAYMTLLAYLGAMATYQIGSLFVS